MTAPDHQKQSCHASHDCGCEDKSIELSPTTTTPAVADGWQSFSIPSMDCPVEEGQIRQALESVHGIKGLRFELGARRLSIQADASALDEALALIKKQGFQPSPVRDGRHTHHDHDHDHDAGWPRLIGALLLATGAELLHALAPSSLVVDVVGMALALVAIVLSGLGTYQKGWSALRVGKLNINALMTVAVSGAFLIGQWPEAAMVMALYAIAEMIEAKSVDRARGAIQSLLDLTPKEAVVQHMDGHWSAIPSAQVPVGTTVRIQPGERVPLDGVVTAGTSAVNQAPVTGESMPVDKRVGDSIYAGTINQTGELHFQTTAEASDTTLAHIIEAVERAQGNRAPTQRFVDRFAEIYTPSVFVIAVAVALLSPWLLGVTWLQAIYKALVLLVIACPCALVISTPVTVVSALAAAARRGILIKGGVYLEQARKIRVVAMDKTGTLTIGKPVLVDWHPFPADDLEARPSVAAMAASLAARSDHPVSQAIVKGLNTREIDVQGFHARPGHGVEAVIDGQVVALANHQWMEARKQCSIHLENALNEHQRAGRTVSILASENAVLGLFAVADQLKAEAPEAVQLLQKAGVKAVLLSGDNEQVVKLIADQAGIDEHQAQLLPQGKLDALDVLRHKHGLVAMVGDGINDAPALAQADIGIAMGVMGSDTAVEAADVVIMNDDLRRIPELIQLSHRTHAILWQNIALALGIKALFLLLAVLGHATMWMAVFADMGASLLVVANGLRMLRLSRSGP